MAACKGKGDEGRREDATTDEMGSASAFQFSDADLTLHIRVPTLTFSPNLQQTWRFFNDRRKHHGRDETLFAFIASLSIDMRSHRRSPDHPPSLPRPGVLSVTTLWLLHHPSMPL